MTAHMDFLPADAHEIRTRCPRCKTFYWDGDQHTCPVPGPTNADVLDAAFPAHPQFGAAHMPAVACPDDCEHRAWPLTPAAYADRIEAARRLDTAPRSAA